jgi:RNA polymerase sigma factor (sigma-70 family)
VPIRPIDPESSVELIQRLKGGDADALERLMARYLVPLQRWAHGRLPCWARDMSDTQDIVQDAVVRVLGHLSAFQPRGSGALHAYLRTAVKNRILDEIRRVHRHVPPESLDEEPPSPDVDPLEVAIGRQTLDRYEMALAGLRDDDREIIIARVEWGLSYEEIAAASGKPSPNAARVAVRRAVLRLAAAMKPDEGHTS